MSHFKMKDLENGDYHMKDYGILSSECTMRRNLLNLLNWYNLVSISKKLRFYIFGVVRI